MDIRKLKIEDAPLMLEWMHDDSVVHNLQADFSYKTIDDCYAFIEKSHEAKDNIHLAIVDENNTYMGTVSLKNIYNNTAEFAVTVRNSAMGKGYANYAMKRIIEKGFEEWGLMSIYWCVSPENTRALRFYDKNGYCRVSPEFLNIRGNYTEAQIQAYYWYNITNCKKRDNEKKKVVRSHGPLIIH